MKVDPASPAPLARSQVIVAHLALHAAGIDSVATGTDALLQDFLQDGFMKGFLLLRGE